MFDHRRACLAAVLGDNVPTGTLVGRRFLVHVKVLEIFGPVLLKKVVDSLLPCRLAAEETLDDARVLLVVCVEKRSEVAEDFGVNLIRTVDGPFNLLNRRWADDIPALDPTGGNREEEWMPDDALNLKTKRASQQGRCSVCLVEATGKAKLTVMRVSGLLSSIR